MSRHPRLLVCALIALFGCGLSGVPALPAGLIHAASVAPGTYAGSQWGMRQIRAYKAWTVATTQGAGVAVCDVDTGVDTSHPDLASAVIGGTNTLPGSTGSYVDDEGHGTHTAGIILGRGQLVSGVAPQASLLAAKVLAADGSGSAQSVGAAIYWCTSHGAAVINMSLGGTADIADGMEAAVDFACAHGVDMAVASGNDAEISNQHPATIDSPCLISVNANDPHGDLTSFSNWGAGWRAVDAPGINILSDWPGAHVASASGTSMAAPFVSGCLALLRGQGASAQRAVLDVLDTAHYIDHSQSAGFDRSILGFGVLDCYAAVRFQHAQG